MADPAVTRLMHRPRDRNARAPRHVYRCGRCRFRTVMLTHAWVHSLLTPHREG